MDNIDLRKYIETTNYSVLISCFTFNQAKYIADALNGFAMQKTSFKFLSLIVDDCSTDGEQVVLHQWVYENCNQTTIQTFDIDDAIVDIIEHKTNKNCQFAFYYLKKNLYKQTERKMALVFPWKKVCKYEALCEGDDYWIDDKKLQKQVDILEKDSSISLVHTYYATLNECDGKTHKNIKQHEGNIIIQSKFPTIKSKSILDNNKYMVVTPTVMYRIEDWKKVYMKDSFLYSSSYFSMGDAQMYYGLSKVGGIIYLPDLTTIYRYNKGSASRPLKIIDACRFLFSAGEMRTYASFCWGGSQQEVKYFWENYALKYYYICISYDSNFKSKIPELVPFLTESNWEIRLLRNFVALRYIVKTFITVRGLIGQYISKYLIKNRL